VIIDDDEPGHYYHKNDDERSLPADRDNNDKSSLPVSRDNDKGSSPVNEEFPPLRLSQPVQDECPYLTTKDFNYTMSLLDNKINVLYKLCRSIGDKQHENSATLRKLVAVDELSDNFWNVSF
jgi:hypothetical protein